MIALTEITNIELFIFIAFKLLSRKVYKTEKTIETLKLGHFSRK